MSTSAKKTDGRRTAADNDESGEIESSGDQGEASQTSEHRMSS